MEMQILLGLVCIFTLHWSGVVATENTARNARNPEHAGRSQSRQFNSETFLEKFGYLEPIEGEGGHSNEARAAAIRAFQDFNGLPTTGILDTATHDKMQQRRCGLPDILPEAYSTHGLKWDNNEVTWRLQRSTGQLPNGSQRRAFYNAFRKWSAVTPLTFRESGGDADIIIKFVSWSHGDGSSFDGRGQTLAHAFFPGASDISGDTHFDESEQWTEYTNDGTNLEIVAAHEFGHALGLGHSRDGDALMAPYYKGYDRNYALGRDDVQGIQSLYGSSRGPVTPRPTRRPRPTQYPRRTRRPTQRPRRTPRPTQRPRRTPRPTQRPRRTLRPTQRPRRTRRPIRTPRPTQRPRRTQRPRYTQRPRPTTQRPGREYCNKRFDAVVVAHDSNTYIFNGRDVYRLNSDGYGVAERSRIQRVFPGAPINMGAAVYSTRQRKLFFFKGSKLWRYTGFTLDEGYPTTLNGYYRGIKAAVEWSDGDIYVFKGSGYSVWNERYANVPRGYPLQVTTYWAGVPVNVEAAMRWRDGFTYFFKGDNYFKFSDFRRSVMQEYPKPKAAAWLGCDDRIPH